MQLLHKRLFSLLISAMLVITHVANAEETAQPFNGVYTGIETGASFGQKGRYDDAAQFYAGGMAGYRNQTPSNLVYGVEATFGKTGSPLGFDVPVNDPPNNLSPDFMGENVPFILDNKYELSLAALAGKAFGAENESLIFVKAGLAANRRKVLDFYTCRAEVCAAVISFELLEQTHYNLLVGAGYERQVKGGIRMRFSFDYIAPSDLNDINFQDADKIDLINTKFSLIYQF